MRGLRPIRGLYGRSTQAPVLIVIIVPPPPVYKLIRAVVTGLLVSDQRTYEPEHNGRRKRDCKRT
jgi:hypothetical protein